MTHEQHGDYAKTCAATIDETRDLLRKAKKVWINTGAASFPISKRAVVQALSWQRGNLPLHAYLYSAPEHLAGSLWIGKTNYD